MPHTQRLQCDNAHMQCDEEGCCLVVTTGGTGPAVRDVTPEATEAVRSVISLGNTHGSEQQNGVQVCKRMMPGYGEQMRAISLK